MKRWQWLAGGALLLILILAFSLRSSSPKGEKVYVEPVKRRDVEAVVSAPGQVDPKVKVNISANVMGKIERLYFNEGDLVRRGQPLVEIERAALTAQRDRLRSEMANRRIDVQRAQIQLANARRNLERAQVMQNQGIQAPEMYDRARFEFDTAQANLAAAEESVRQAQAGLAQATDDLSKATIVSPLTGKVVSLNAREGEVVVTGTMNNPGSIIATIADLSEVLIEAEVNETEVVKIRLGQPARVRVDAVPDKVYDGLVVEIGSSATQRAGVAGVRYFKVKIALELPDEQLRPGMTAQVEILTETAKDVITVPVQSVVERAADEVTRKRSRSKAADLGDEEQPKKKYVLLVKDNKVDLVEVTTGVSNNTHVAIVNGLKGDESVITGPFRTLRRLRTTDRVEPERERERAAAQDKDEEDKDE